MMETANPMLPERSPFEFVAVDGIAMNAAGAIFRG